MSGSSSRSLGVHRISAVDVSQAPIARGTQAFTKIDQERELALIATTPVQGKERQIGVARYVKESSPGDAEFAIVLSDDWQGRGLGIKLLSSLLAAAKNNGLRRLVGTTMSENAGMLALGRKLGFKLARDPDSATITNLTIDLAGWSPRRVKYRRLQVGSLASLAQCWLTDMSALRRIGDRALHFPETYECDRRAIVAYSLVRTKDRSTSERTFVCVTSSGDDRGSAGRRRSPPTTGGHRRSRRS